MICWRFKKIGGVVLDPILQNSNKKEKESFVVFLFSKLEGNNFAGNRGWVQCFNSGHASSGFKGF